MKILAVVAHPDDHVLWMGGTILRLNSWEWHILSLCNSHNDDFDPKEKSFNLSCKELGIKKYEALKFKDYQSRELMEIEQSLKMQREILAFADKEYDLIFTHSMWPECEYDFHANHLEARDSVNRLVDEKLLIAKGIIYFCFKSGGCQQPVIADEDRADYKLELVQEEINTKRELKNFFSSWAEGDLRGLALWDNDELKIEAFNFKKFTEVELPQDFIKI